MTRSEAIDLLARHELAELTASARESHLLNWWSIDEEDEEFAGLPVELKQALLDTDAPADPSLRLFDPLLLIALRYCHVGVRNDYLSRRLAALGIDAAVDGPVEPMVACPCCGYRSLGQRGHYEICRVCFWEDEGNSPLDQRSGSNHMTLREARENFQRIGACDEGSLVYVLPDGRDRYA
ncbi:hypothetical protein CDL60_25615 [Roseateles noduli]|nr:hypothetical protein CDL60_25615 [Roseateles noduli]